MKTIKPNKIIEELCKLYDISTESLAEQLVISTEDARLLREEKKRIDKELAYFLKEVFGISKKYWLKKEKTFLSNSLILEWIDAYHGAQGGI